MLNTYLLCVTHSNLIKGSSILSNYTSSINDDCTLILVENGDFIIYKEYVIRCKNHRSIKIFFNESPNKASCINQVIENKIKDKEALIICIDDDIDFPETFVKRYQEVTFEKDKKYFFGGSMRVDLDVDNYIKKGFSKLYQPSQFSKPDNAFLNQKQLFFLGCNYSFFKSQWLAVNGLDERFGPGSKFGLGADESVFQKKLKYVGYKPFFVINNQVIHKPELESYQINAVKKRTVHNGYTHGFQYIIESKSFLKLDYFYIITGMLKSLLVFKFKSQKENYIYKKYYTLGYIKAFFTYLKIDNRHSIYHNLKR